MKACPERPNILIILTDQQGASMMSCTGNRYISTPNMDSLAKDGVRFEAAYCTNPVCVPSRTSLMTGRMPSALRIRNNNAQHVETVPDSVLQNTLGVLLSNAGYETVYGGKIHLPKPLQPDICRFRILTSEDRMGLADQCSEFIRNRKQDRPFFLYTSFVNPHDICYMAIRAGAGNREYEQRLMTRGTTELASLDEALKRPEHVDDNEFFTRYCPEIPPNFNVQADEPEAIQRLREERPFKKYVHEHWTERDWRMHRWAYCRLTEQVDREIGQMLQSLRETGQAENTVVIFTSDHGDLDSAHRMEHKTAMYQEALRVPLLVSQPGKTIPDHVSSQLISNGLDLLPTLCDYGGIPEPEGIDGKSFRSLAENQDASAIHSWIPLESQIGRGIVTPSFKYIRYDEGKHHEQLYDLRNDPYETRNHINRPELQSQLNEFRTIFRSIDNVAEHVPFR